MTFGTVTFKAAMAICERNFSNEYHVRLRGKTIKLFSDKDTAMNYAQELRAIGYEGVKVTSNPVRL